MMMFVYFVLSVFSSYSTHVWFYCYGFDYCHKTLSKEDDNGITDSNIIQIDQKEMSLASP